MVGEREGDCEKENGVCSGAGKLVEQDGEARRCCSLYAFSAHLSGEAHEVAKNEIISAVLALSAHDDAILLHDEVNVVTY